MSSFCTYIPCISQIWMWGILKPGGLFQQTWSCWELVLSGWCHQRSVKSRLYYKILIIPEDKAEFTGSCYIETEMVSPLSDKRGVKDGSESILQHGEPSLYLYLLRIWSTRGLKTFQYSDAVNKENTSELSWFFNWLSQLLLVHFATSTIPEIWANCSEDVLLMCPDVNPDDMDFFSLIWYKVREQPAFHTELCTCSICRPQPLILMWFLVEQFQNDSKHAIIRRGKSDGRTLKYKFSRPAEFGKNLGLLLHNVTPLDSGSYECAISANVMGQNQNLQVDLVVKGEF